MSLQLVFHNKQKNGKINIKDYRPSKVGIVNIVDSTIKKLISVVPCYREDTSIKEGRWEYA